MTPLTCPLGLECENWYLSFLQDKEKKLIEELGFKRIKTQKKIFYCEQGKIVYSFVFVKPESFPAFSPLRRFLGIEKYQNMSEDFKNKLIMKATRTTYQKAIEDIHESFSFWISKKTLNRYVIESTERVNVIQEAEEDQNILLADSTKARNGKKGHHEIMAVMSLNYQTNSSSLTAFGVNIKPKELAQKIDLSKYKAFVGDGDLGLRNFFNETTPFQLCHHHAISDVSFFLWRDGMSKKERDPLINRLKATLYTLQNSTKKYWNDRDNERLTKRIIQTKEDLRSLAVDFSIKEKHQAARYIMDHIEHIVTASKLALLGIKVPWTTNHAERLMQEIGIRTKKKGMNWTEKGIKAILQPILKRYFLPKERRNYKEVFTQSIKKVVET